MNGKLTIANIGDSVATLVRKDSSWTKLNEEHTPSRTDEQLRIQNSNGIIFNNRVEGQLSVSRAFGDLKLKDFVISEPEGKTWPLTAQDDLLILSSDGLYNAYSQEHVVKRVLELRSQGLQYGPIAQTIIEECLALEHTRKHCYDNVTLVIVSLSEYFRER